MGALNLLSMGACVALAEATAYLASKGGVEQATRTLAAEWAPHGVRVNATTIEVDGGFLAAGI